MRFAGLRVHACSRASSAKCFGMESRREDRPRPESPVSPERRIFRSRAARERWSFFFGGAPPIRFHDLSANPKLPRPFLEPVAAIGYPADSHKQLAPNFAAIGASSIWGKVDTGKDWRPEDFRPRSELLLKFGRQNWEGIRAGSAALGFGITS
jgi:hypothetical protein